MDAWDAVFEKRKLTRTPTLVQVKRHNNGESRWDRLGRGHFPLNVPGHMLAQPLHYDHLSLLHNCKTLRCEVFCGCIWEALTLTLRGLVNGQPQFLFWMYVDTDNKDDPSDGLYTMTKDIIPIFSFIDTTLISPMS